MAPRKNISKRRKQIKDVTAVLPVSPSRSEASKFVGDLERRPSAAQHLPLDILSEIFTYAIPTTYSPFFKAANLTQWRAYFSNIFPLNLAVVCRAWRHATLFTSGLWTAFFIEIHSASSRALKVLRNCLCVLLKKSVQTELGLKVGIRFSGTFQFAKACDAVRPLLDCQRRWESVEVCFDKKAEPVGGMTLNVSEFVLLKELLLHGAYWEAQAARPGQHAEGQNVDQELLLPALRALRLFDLQRSTRMSLVAAARNLEELEISINVEERPLGPPLRLESLKKLTVVDICQDSDVLGSLQCPSLEELSLDGMVGPSFRRLRRFIHFSAATLQTLKLAMGQYGGHTPTRDDVQHLQGILATQTQLKILSVTASKQMLDEAILNGLKSVNEVGMFRCCPNLEDLYLCGILGSEQAFTDLVHARWNARRRTIRSMAFHNCRTVHKQGPPHDGLRLIHDVCDCKEEGLMLEVTTKWY